MCMVSQTRNWLLASLHANNDLQVETGRKEGVLYSNISKVEEQQTCFHDYQMTCTDTYMAYL